MQSQTVCIKGQFIRATQGGILFDFAYPCDARRNLKWLQRRLITEERNSQGYKDYYIPKWYADKLNLPY